MTGKPSEVHWAVHEEDLPRLRDFLDAGAGADVNEEEQNRTLLHHAIATELDASAQSGEPLHVDTTALLLAYGADPRRRSAQGRGVSAEHQAWVHGHWLATCLFNAWKRDHPASEPDLGDGTYIGVRLTDRAADQLAEQIAGAGQRPPHQYFVRVYATDSYEVPLWYGLRLDLELKPGDAIEQVGPVKVAVDKFSAPYLRGVTLDYDGAYRWSTG